MKDTEILTRIAEDTAAIRACVERMEARSNPVTVAPFVPDSLPPARLAKFKFYRDTELREFIFERLQEGDMEMTEMRNDAIERFGKERVPSRSSLHRFTVALRREVKSRSLR